MGMCRRCWGLRSGCFWGISFTRIGASTFHELWKQPCHRSVIKLQCTSVRTCVTLSPPQGAEPSRPASSPKLMCTSQLNRTVLHTYWGVCTPVRGLQLLQITVGGCYSQNHATVGDRTPSKHDRTTIKGRRISKATKTKRLLGVAGSTQRTKTQQPYHRSVIKQQYTSAEPRQQCAPAFGEVTICFVVCM
jgi:hypothetical protein